MKTWLSSAAVMSETLRWRGRRLRKRDALPNDCGGWCSHGDGDPKKVLVQLGQVHAGRVMRFTSAKEVKAKAGTIKAYVREAIAVEKAPADEAEDDLRFSGS